MTVTAAQETVLLDVMDRWKAAVDAHEPEEVAALFREDAVFQGLHPYSVGRQGVAAYYASQPAGLGAVYEVLETRALTDDVLLGYLGVDFTFTDRPDLHVTLSVVLTREAGQWSLAHYQVTRLD
ncbi:SgcJ/EcaC family oxidoreductase [Streptomyces griseoaurantiacus]|uniref:SgcJ/EcaC family oxidoreductase n=1 Tax=Streptomyces griseoaurantiacus TaxID=68213 RepID=A0A7W2DP67_9ACTN|nr:SgcJ/EcaC family oxidoreductase [Streptomyces griseoaurantiacus]MBA5220424.1 SgcJ/EcaC family oxidoreductase [Streptomyces griseoaurantiacus]